MSSRDRNRDWIEGAWGEIVDLTDNQVNYELVNDADLEDKEDGLTVVRIIGDLVCRPSGARLAGGGEAPAGTLVYVHERIYVAQETDGAIDFHNPALAINVEVPFLWHRVTLWIRATAAAGSFDPLSWVRLSDEPMRHQERPQVDVGVKRMLGDVSRLVYSANGSASDMTATVTLLTLPNLRVYVLS